MQISSKVQTNFNFELFELKSINQSNGLVDDWGSAPKGFVGLASKGFVDGSVAAAKGLVEALLLFPEKGFVEAATLPEGRAGAAKGFVEVSSAPKGLEEAGLAMEEEGAAVEAVEGVGAEAVTGVTEAGFEGVTVVEDVEGAAFEGVTVVEDVEGAAFEGVAEGAVVEGTGAFEVAAEAREVVVLLEMVVAEEASLEVEGIEAAVSGVEAAVIAGEEGDEGKEEVLVPLTFDRGEEAMELEERLLSEAGRVPAAILKVTASTPAG